MHVCSKYQYGHMGISLMLSLIVLYCFIFYLLLRRQPRLILPVSFSVPLTYIIMGLLGVLVVGLF